eukprot:Sspe_Gene.72187::Locus_43004_Transcript_1_1_Confidence_1.000_Length_3620::g.72187::m.72187
MAAGAVLLLLLAVVAEGSFTYKEVPGTMCTDGTTSGYYFRNTAPQLKTVVIALEGGGMCGFPQYKGADCRQRALGPLGSSKHFAKGDALEIGNITWRSPEDDYETSILHSNAAVNPSFYLAHHIWIPNCYGDAFTGQVTTASPLTYGFYFAGSTSLYKILKDVNQTAELQSATRIVFTGVNSGGLGVLNHCNRFSTLFPQAQVLCSVVDGLIFPNGGDGNIPSDFADFARNETSSPTRYYGMLFLWHWDVDPLCVVAEQLSAARCTNAATIAKHVKNKLFLAQHRYDSFLIFDLLGMPKDRDRVSEEYIAYVGESVSATLLSLSAHSSTIGLFMPSCLQHAVRMLPSGGENRSTISVGKMSLMASLDEWTHGSQKVVHVDTCDGYNCNPTCVPYVPPPATPEVPSKQMEEVIKFKGEEVEKEDTVWIPAVAVSALLLVAGFLIIIAACVKRPSLAARWLALAGTGMLLIGLSTLFFGLVPQVVNTGVHAFWPVEIKDGKVTSDFYTTKRDDATPRWRIFYVFNITNLDAVIQNGDKPVVVEVGPFRYRYYLHAHEASVINDGEQVRYIDFPEYEFVSEGSAYPDDNVMITTLNVPYYALASSLSKTLNVGGEGELQLAAPSVFVERLLQTVSAYADNDTAAHLWGSTSRIPFLYDSSNNYIYPFVVGFAEYTHNVSRTKTTMPLETAKALLAKIRFGKTGEGAKPYVSLLMMLEGLHHCVTSAGLTTAEVCDAQKSRPPPCASYYVMLGMLNVEVPGLNDPCVSMNLFGLLSEWSLSQMNILRFLSTDSDGVTHGLFTRRPARNIFFSVSDPIYKQVTGDVFQGLFRNYPDHEEGKRRTQNEYTMVGTGKKDWRDSYRVYEEDNVQEVKYWRERFLVNRHYDRHVPKMGYGMSGRPSAPDKVVLWNDLVWRDILFVNRGEETLKGVVTHSFHLSNLTSAIDPGFSNDVQGFINMGPVYNFDMYLSPPHMAYAFGSPYREKLVGMEPDEDPTWQKKTRHTISVNIEPISGVVVGIDRRIQTNFLVGGIDGVQFGVSWPAMKDPEGIIMPVLWVDDHAVIRDDDAKDLERTLYVWLDFRQYFCLLSWIFGGMCFAIGLVGSIVTMRRTRVTSISDQLAAAERARVGSIAELMHNSGQSVPGSPKSIELEEVPNGDEYPNAVEVGKRPSQPVSASWVNMSPRSSEASPS